MNCSAPPQSRTGLLVFLVGSRARYNPGMDEREKRAARAALLRDVICFFVLVLYVLGIGPATLLANYVDEHKASWARFTFRLSSSVNCASQRKGQ